MLSEENPLDAGEGSSSSAPNEDASNNVPTAEHGDDSAVKVTLAIDSASVKAGDVLTGRVTLECAKPVEGSRVVVTVMGRERVVLQKTSNIAETDLAPFMHVQGTSHREHQEYLKVHPRPEVRDRVKEREWRARMGRTDSNKHVTIIDDVVQTESIVHQKVVVFKSPGGSAGTIPSGIKHKHEFEFKIPDAAPSSFFIAGGNWSKGNGYLGEIVYTAIAELLTTTEQSEGTSMQGHSSAGNVRSAVGRGGDDAVPSGGHEGETTAARKHFLVTAALASEEDTLPTIGGTRSFITGGTIQSTVGLDKSSYAPGDAIMAHVHANCQVPQSCSAMGIEVVGALALVSKDQKFNHGTSLANVSFDGLPPCFWGDRYLPFRLHLGLPASTKGKLVQCEYMTKVVISLPGTINLTLEMPMKVLPGTSMYSHARPWGAPPNEPNEPPPLAQPGRMLRPAWKEDKDALACRTCAASFTLFNRRHHCRHCGAIFCKKCCSQKTNLPRLGYSTPQRVCDTCMPEATSGGGANAQIEQPAAA